jgi:hypothetical protein
MLSLFFALVFAWIPAGASNDFSRIVNDAHQAGQLTVQEKLDILETAVKYPQHLPTPWKEILRRYPIAPQNATAILVDTLQERARAGLRSLYTYPAELPYFLDSETFPVRVYYDDTTLRNLAQTVLTAAEHSLAEQILEWQWYAPPIETPEGRFRLYVTTSGMGGGGGYTAPLGPWSNTDWDDCVTYIVIDRENDERSGALSWPTSSTMPCRRPWIAWSRRPSGKTRPVI